MKIKFALIISLFCFDSLFSQDNEMVTIKLFRKPVKITFNQQEITPEKEKQIPFNSKVECSGMGFLEFDYKESSYRINKNTTILISKVVAASIENKNFKPSSFTTVSGVRGKDKEKRMKKRKKKRKIEE